MTAFSEEITGTGVVEFASAPVLYVLTDVVTYGDGRILDPGSEVPRWMEVGFWSLGAVVTGNSDGLSDGVYYTPVTWIQLPQQIHPILNQNENQFNRFYYKLYEGWVFRVVGYES